MADENTAVDSSTTAVLEAPPAPPTDAKDYAVWRQTGKLPEAKPPKPEESAPSKESSATDNKVEKTAPASEAGETHQEHRPRSNAETRLNDLLADLKKAGLSPAELKTYRREAKAETVQPKPEQTVKPVETEAPKRPKLEDFIAAGKSYEDFEAAKDQYADDIAEFKAKKAVADYRAEQQREAADRETRAKLSDAKERYGAEAESVIRATATTIGSSSEVPLAVKAIVDGSPVLADLLFVLGSKEADFSEFMELSRTDPGAAIRKVVLLERLVKDELAKGAKPVEGETQRDAAGKFVKEKAPEKKLTEAPPPPKELGGKGSAPGDEVERAASQNDFRMFREAANRRDLAQRKGQ